MTTKYLVDTITGEYLGAHVLAENAEGEWLLPEGTIEVSTPPADGRQKWTGSEWAALNTGAISRDTIEKLEASITDRRIREAVLGVDNGWLADINAQIAVLRTQL